MGPGADDLVEVDDVCVAPGPYRSEEVWISARRSKSAAKTSTPVPWAVWCRSCSWKAWPLATERAPFSSSNGSEELASYCAINCCPEALPSCN